MSKLGRLKTALLGQPVFQQIWGTYRCGQLHRDYVARREYYAHIARDRELVDCEHEVITSIRARLAERGYTPVPRQMGEIHTFAFIPHLSWHTALLPDLRTLGPVTEFDYMAYGFRLEEFHRRGMQVAQRR